MKLGLALKKLIRTEKNDGTTRIHSNEIAVIDSDTGEELSERIGFLWGDKSILLEGDNPLLTPEHFDGEPDNASYLILIVRCDEARNIS